MVEALRFVFEDFWRFLGVCVFMMIIALWKPVEINIMHGTWEERDDDAE